MNWFGFRAEICDHQYWMVRILARQQLETANQSRLFSPSSPIAHSGSRSHGGDWNLPALAI
jgi:hypothetical protein